MSGVGSFKVFEAPGNPLVSAPVEAYLLFLIALGFVFWCAYRQRTKVVRKSRSEFMEKFDPLDLRNHQTDKATIYKFIEETDQGQARVVAIWRGAVRVCADTESLVPQNQLMPFDHDAFLRGQ